MACVTLVLQPGIDAYVRVNFAGNPIARTKYVNVRGHKDLSAEFNTQLWLPVMTPTMTSNIEIVVCSVACKASHCVG